MYIVKIIGIAALTILFGFLLTAAYHALVEMLSEESNFTTGGWRDEYCLILLSRPKRLRKNNDC